MCGATYIGQIEHEFMHSKKLGLCANCLNSGMDRTLRRCSACIMIDYCSKQYGRIFSEAMSSLTVTQVSKGPLA